MIYNIILLKIKLYNLRYPFNQFIAAYFNYFSCLLLVKTGAFGTKEICGSTELEPLFYLRKNK